MAWNWRLNYVWYLADHSVIQSIEYNWPRLREEGFLEQFLPKNERKKGTDY